MDKKGSKKQWKTMSKKRIFHNAWIDIEEWKLRVTDQYVGTYTIEKTRDTVVIFPITADHKILLLKEYYIAHEQYVYSLPAGVVEHDDHLRSAHNELREETGYATEDMTYMGSSFLAKYKTGSLHHYVARDAYGVGEPQLEMSEDIEMSLVTVAEFMQLLRNCQIQDQAEVATAYLALDYLGLLING